MHQSVTRDFFWKLFSLLLAVGIWLTIHKLYEEPKASATGASSTVTYDNLPVLIVSRTLDVRDFRVAPSAVSVTVSGPAKLMGILQANQIHAIADVTDINSTREKKVRVDVTTPPGVTLVNVNPEKLAVIIPPDKKP